MATGKGVDQGKSKFVEQYLADHSGSKLAAVNQAWNSAGNEGSISESLYYKLRPKQGRAVKQSDESPGKPKPGSKPKEKRPEPTAPAQVAPTDRHDEDDDFVDEIEERIDELIQRVMQRGGRPDVAKALRRARRILVRSQEV